MKKEKNAPVPLILILILITAVITISCVKTQNADYIFAAKILFVIVLMLIFLLATSLRRLNKDEYKELSDFPVYNGKDVVIPYKLNYLELKKEIFSIYNKLENIYYDYDCEKIREIVTDELYNTYRSKIAFFKKENKKKLFKNIIVKKINIDNVDDRSNYYDITVTVNVLCKEYIISNNETPLEKYKNEYTEITYLMNFIQSKEKINETKKCPNCGKKLNDNETSKCPNCNSIVRSNIFKTTLAQIITKEEKSIPFKERNYLLDNPRKDELVEYGTKLITILKTYSNEKVENLEKLVDERLYKILSKEKTSIENIGNKIIIKDMNLVNAESLSDIQSKVFKARLYIKAYDYIIDKDNNIDRGLNNRKVITEYETIFRKEDNKLCDIEIISQKYEEEN